MRTGQEWEAAEIKARAISEIENYGLWKITYQYLHFVNVLAAATFIKNETLI